MLLKISLNNSIILPYYYQKSKMKIKNEERRKKGCILFNELI